MKYFIETNQIVNPSDEIKVYNLRYSFYEEMDSNKINLAEVLDTDDILVFHSSMVDGERVFVLKETRPQ